MKNKEKSLKHAVSLFAFLLIVWGFYRFMFQLPESVEELTIKPVIWLGATYYFLRKERLGISSLGYTTKNLFPAIYFALSLAAFFGLEGLVINYLKHGGFNFNANLGDNIFLISLMLSVATAVSEETAFRGFIFNRVSQALNNELTANLITSAGWTIIHLPIAIFVWNLNTESLFTFILLSFLFAVGASFVFARTKNILSPILLHIVWQWPIILFR